MLEPYVLLDDLRDAMGSLEEKQEVYAERLLAVASAGLRRIFSDCGRDLDIELATGTVERILVEQVVLQMTMRSLSAQSAPLGGDFQQYSQAAGGYSFSVTSAGSTVVVRRDEARLLGLPTVRFGAISVYGQKPGYANLRTIDLGQLPAIKGETL